MCFVGGCNACVTYIYHTIPHSRHKVICAQYSLSFIEGIEIGKLYMQDKGPQTDKADRLLYIVYLWQQGEDRSSAARKIRVATKWKIRCRLVERAYRQQQTVP